MDPCGHIIEVECYRSTGEVKCSAYCEKILQCGHQCAKRCSDQCSALSCKVYVQQLLDCTHTVDRECSQEVSDLKCPAPCKYNLSCGHKCPGKCGDCKIKGHQSCTKKCEKWLIFQEHECCTTKCEKWLICGHKCKENCRIGSSSPCTEKQCITKCEHSKCALQCSEICNLCKEPCSNQCEHSKCTKLCSEACNRKPCNQPCQEKLQCDHECIGLCGEKCPPICRICKPDNEVFKSMTFQIEADSRFVQIDCGHIFESRGMDRYMLEFKKGESKPVQYKNCLQCMKPILTCTRYMCQINRVLNDINKIKKAYSNQKNNVQQSAIYVQEDLTTLKNNLKDIDATQKFTILTSTMITKLQEHVTKVLTSDSAELLNELILYLDYTQDLLAIALTWSSHKNLFQRPEFQTHNQLCYEAESQVNAFRVTDGHREKVKKFAKEVTLKFKVKRMQLEEIEAVESYKGEFYRCYEGHLFIGKQKTEGITCPSCK